MLRLLIASLPAAPRTARAIVGRMTNPVLVYPALIMGS